MKLSPVPQPGAGDFIDYCRVLALSGGGLGDMQRTAAAAGLHISPRARAIIQKANEIDPITFQTGQEYILAAAGMVESLGTFGVFDRLLADGFRRAPMGQAIAIATAGATGNTTEPFAPKPISSLSLDAGALARRKASVIVVATEELVRNAAASGLLSRELRSALAVTTDGAFLGQIVSDISSPSPSSAMIASGTFGDDLAALIAAITTGSTSKMFLVVDPLAAKAISGMQGDNGPKYPAMSPRGGKIGEWLQVLVSEALDDWSGLILDADQFLADSGEVVADSATHATLEMRSIFAATSPPTMHAQEFINMFQTNSVALRIERHFAFRQARAGAAALMSGLGAATSP